MQFLTKKVKFDFLESCQDIQTGRLRLRTPEGEIFDFGDQGIEAELHLHDWSVITSAAARGGVSLGETYSIGLWETPSLVDLGTVALENLEQLETNTPGNVWNGLKMRVLDCALRTALSRRSSNNFAGRFDVGNEFYQQWLDPGMTFSSALFLPGDDDLQRGQNRKHDRILGRLTHDASVLEIGCGWGGFAERAADAGHQVTGLTGSPRQKGYADARLDGRGEIRLQDYRNCQGKFDNVVSIEMLENVEPRHWPIFFATLRNRLAEGGRAVLQAITLRNASNSRLGINAGSHHQHKFANSKLLTDATITDQARKAGLIVSDRFAFGQDYARTCNAWSSRLQAQETRLHRLGYGDPVQRAWRYSLGTAAAAFATGRMDVVQIELAHA